MRKEIRILRLMVLMSAAALLVFGCSSKNTVDTTPTPAGTEVEVSASPSSVETNQSSVVEATVTVAADAVAGQAVYFTVSPSSAGSVTPQFDTTGADGVAATVFTAATAGAVVVQAQLVGTDIASTVGLSVSEGSTSGTGNINVSASRSLLLANGHDTSEVTVVVRDALGQEAPDGTIIRLVAGEKFVDKDGNGYWSQNIDSLVFDANGNDGWDAYGLIPSTVAVSGGEGQAIVDFVSGDEAYTIYVKATVDDGGITGYGEISLQISPNAVLYSIYLASDSMTLSVKGTGGIETGTLRAIGYDTHGNSVPEGMPIVFAIIDGPDGGEHLDTLGYGPDTAYTNSEGEASTSISSGTVSGTIRIRAYSGVTLSEATQVLVCAGPPEYIVVGTGTCNIRSWDRVGDSVSVVAIVSDVYHNPVNDSTVVYFTTDEGTIKATEERTMFDNGQATTWWYSGSDSPAANGRVWVYAETSGGTVFDSVLFFNSFIAALLDVPDWRDNIVANGYSNFTVTVTAVDVNGNPVIGGTKFEASADLVTVTGGEFQDGCYSSAGISKITSKTLVVDGSTTGANDDGIGGVDAVRYWVEGGASVTVYLNVLTGTTYSGSSSLEGATTAQPGEVVSLTAKIGDRWGNPLGDHTLYMEAFDGIVTGATQETNEYGEAQGFRWTAPALDGDYNIRVTDTDPLGNGQEMVLKITVKAAS